MFRKPIGVILIVLFLIAAFVMDFYNGTMMIIGAVPIPPVYSILGTFYGVLLFFGGIIGIFLLYGMWNLKNWARLILLVGFPAQVIFNIILDPTIQENYVILAIYFIVAGYLLMPSTREHFNSVKEQS